MANFYMTLSAEEIARQVASLLNAHNQLRKRHTMYTLLRSPGAYFVEVVNHQVVACQAIHRVTGDATKLFHLCVAPSFRRQGLARKIKETALNHVTTPYAYVTIREDNVASINLNTSLGFALVKKEWVGDHHVLTLARAMAHGRYITSGLDSQPDERGEVATRSANELFYTGNKY